MSEVTRLLSAIEQDDPHAAEQLLPLVYDELRELAAQKLGQEKLGQALQPTALVHEVYLRLVGTDQEQPWDSRRHFLAAAAEAQTSATLMRRNAPARASKPWTGWERTWKREVSR
jgi:hypothetical protein